MKNGREGISLISLIITIIVIIILAAIVIFSGLNTPDSASFAGFTQQVDNVYSAVMNKFGDLKAKHAIKGDYRTDEQIYIEIAVGDDPDQYASMGTTEVTNFKSGTEIKTSTGIQNIQTESAKNKEHSLGMTLPKVRESNTAWYVTKEGKVFNANGYVYDGKTYFNGSVYQANELPSNSTSNANRAQAIYNEAISKDLNVVTTAPVEGSGDVNAGVNPNGGNNGGGNGGNETPTTYTVTFNSNGGSSVASIIGIESGSTISEPTAPTKGTDTFGGWYTDDGTFANAFNFGTAITGNITLYAKWTAAVSSSYSAGNEVTVGGEKFFVIADNGSTVTLLAKYCLNQAGTAQDKSLTSNSSGSGRKFSSTDYWSSDYTSNMNLNNYTMPLSETTSNNVIKVAQAYGTAKGGTGRLMKKEEVEGICGTTLSSDSAISVQWLLGKGDKYAGDEATASRYLRYWLGSANDTSSVWFVNGNSSDLGNSTYTRTSNGVRPVIEISKSSVS